MHIEINSGSLPMINIALCFHDSDGLYYRKATTTIISVLEHTKESVHFHIVHDETLTSVKQMEMRAVIEHYKQHITFYTAPEINPAVVKTVPKHFGRGTLYRLFLHKLLKNIDKIIYIDCDIICEELDIKELFDHNLGNYPLAAVLDYGMICHNKKYLASIGVSETKYFNAGVLLLNMAWFKENGNKLLEIMIAELQNNSKLKFADQDVLNIVFGNDPIGILYLDEKFNYTTGFAGRHLLEMSYYKNKILHLTGEKPWKQFSPSSLFFWKYYNKSPWWDCSFKDILESTIEEEAELVYFFIGAHKNNLRWLRRYRDYKSLGFFKYIIKCIFKK